MSKSSSRILLLRHGDVLPPPGCTVYGDLNVPLSELGRRQSSAAANRLRGEDVAAIVSSNLDRAIYLAERVAEVHPQASLAQDPRLREIHRGHWAGLSDAAIEAGWPGVLERYRRSGSLLAPPGGESIAQQAARVRAGLAQLAAAHPGQTVVVCAHLWVLRIAAVTALGEPLEAVIQHEFEKCSQLEIQWADAQGVRFVGALPGPLVESAEQDGPA